MTREKLIWDKPSVGAEAGRRYIHLDAVDCARDVEKRGDREILLTPIVQERPSECFDHDLDKRAADALSIPVIAHSGAGFVKDIGKFMNVARMSAFTLGSML